MKKRGISPVIATVLLIAMVVVIGLIVFIWFRGMIGESVTKFGKNIQLVCDDIDFDASYSGGSLQLINTGNVPIFKMQIQLSKPGSHSTQEINNEEYSEWDKSGLSQGGTFSTSMNLGSDIERITLIPILAGTSDKGKRTYVCEEQYGKEIVL
jgi:flagellin-like protein